ncbi:glycosyltransferase [Shewanella algae]|uniref:glycosyltransferase family 4 protein n=1 Tax=Shewanella algae TaxID=38313 RepID=UPI0031F56DED
MKINIVIFSNLSISGGGRETWLKNICEGGGKFTEINIYFFYDRKCKDSLSNNFSADNVRFHYFTPFKNSILNLICFHISTYLKIRRNRNPTFFIGTLYDSLFVRFYKFLNVTTYIWIRSILEKEIYHRTNFIKRKVFLFFERFNLSSADYIIANGWDTKDFYKKFISDITVIPNSVDLSRFEAKRLNPNSSSYKISYIGRLSKEKGIIDFINSVKIFLKSKSFNKGITFSFEIVGDGPLREVVVDLIKDFDGIEYLGPLPNDCIPNYLHSVDASVCLTYAGDMGGGGVSNGLLELMASRTLIIAWDNYIFKQVLDDNMALFVKEGEPVALADSYTLLESSDFNYKDKIDNAYSRVMDFTISEHVDKIIELINREN